MPSATKGVWFFPLFFTATIRCLYVIFQRGQLSPWAYGRNFWTASSPAIWCSFLSATEGLFSPYSFHPHQIEQQIAEFRKEPLRGNTILFCGRDLKFFHLNSNSGTKLKIIWFLNISKHTCIFLSAEHPKMCWRVRRLPEELKPKIVCVEG